MSVRRKLVSNFLSLSGIQFVNYFIPLLTLPYLIRILGPHNYGLVAFTQSINQYLVIITGYGFNLSATPQIALRRSKREDISPLISSIFGAKFLLLMISIVVFFALLLLVPELTQIRLLFLLSFGYVIADFVFPIWMFQGLEDMKYIGFVNVASKLLGALGVFMFIRHPSNYPLVPLCNTLGQIIFGIIVSKLVMKKYNIQFYRVRYSDIREQLNQGWLVFLSATSISFYSTINPIILGIFAPKDIVGYYSAAERLIYSGTALLNGFFQAIYPHVTLLFNQSRQVALKFLGKIQLILIPILLAVFVILLSFSSQIIQFLLGPNYILSATVLRILAPLPLVISLNTLFGTQIMLNVGLQKYFTRAALLGAAANLSLSVILVPMFHQLGTATSVVSAETMITGWMYYLLRRRKLIPNVNWK